MEPGGPPTVVTDAVPVPPTRLLALRSDLLPPEVVQQRRLVRTRLVVLASVGTVVVLLAGWYGLATWQVSRQEDKLATAETEAISLRTKQKSYTELITAQTRTTKINNQLSTLLKTDVEWATLTARLRAVAPSGLELTNISVALVDPTTGGTTGGSGVATTASGLPSKDGKTPIGSLSITGNATSKTAIAAYLDSVGDVDGIGNVMLAGVNSQEDGLDFTLRADLSPTLLSNHYAAKTD